MNQFEKEALDTHNLYRASHHASPLSWNKNLALEAQAWAEHLAREDRLKHASTDDGENIYMSFGDVDVAGCVAVDKWYDEVKEYNFSRPGFQSNTGHFTQVVWRGSKELGIGRAQGYDGKVFVVARYKPPGNNLRTFEENVLPGQKHYPVHSSSGWNLPEVNGDSTIDPGLNTSARKNPDRWDSIYTGDKYSPSRGIERGRNAHNSGRGNNRDAPNWGKDANKDISKRSREEKSYGYQEPRKNSWDPRQNSNRQYPPSTIKYSEGVGQDIIFDHKWDSGKWFDEDVIEPTVNTAQHSSPERKILKDSTNVKDAKRIKEKGVASRWQPQGNENKQKDNEKYTGRRGHYEGSVDRNKSANKVRLSMEKWETIGNNDDFDGREDIKVGKSRTRESIKRWEEQSFNQPQLPFQHPRSSQNKTVSPSTRSMRSSQQPIIRAAQSSQVQAEAERWDPLWGDKPLTDHKPRPVSWNSSRFVDDISYQHRSLNEPKKITTTIGDGPTKTVVSSITIVLKGNEGYSPSKARSKSTDDLRRLDRPKSSYTRAGCQPVQEVYPEQRASRTNTRPKSEDFTSRAFDDWETKRRPVEEDPIVPEMKKSNKPYDTTDSSHRDDNARTQFPSLDHFSQQALDCHNVYRALHDVSNLMWSPQIAAEAQAWAEHLARERTLKHSTRERGADGENLAMFSGNHENAAREASDMWYNEVKNYDFSRPGYQPRSGHFTQLVWKGSKEFGMGRAQTSDGQLTIVVARYRPPGNVIRNYELNVFPKHSFF